MGLSAAFRFADGPAGAIVTLIFCHESREKCRIPQANDDVQRDREESMGRLKATMTRAAQSGTRKS